MAPSPTNYAETASFPRVDEDIDHVAAVEYWNTQGADVNGMLGGYPQLTRVDLQASANFLAKLKPSMATKEDLGGVLRGVDCGAG
jgi:protein N-terminal methyltransferase